MPYQFIKKSYINCCSTCSRYGTLTLYNNEVTNFTEKPIGDNRWVNGGFFVLNKAVLNYIRR